jgi:hypothetical protein
VWEERVNKASSLFLSPHKFINAPPRLLQIAALTFTAFFNFAFFLCSPEDAIVIKTCPFRGSGEECGKWPSSTQSPQIPHLITPFQTHIVCHPVRRRRRAADKPAGESWFC